MLQVSAVFRTVAQRVVSSRGVVRQGAELEVHELEPARKHYVDQQLVALFQQAIGHVVAAAAGLALSQLGKDRNHYLERHCSAVWDLVPVDALVT
jgi:hypothetical protein